MTRRIRMTLAIALAIFVVDAALLNAGIMPKWWGLGLFALAGLLALYGLSSEFRRFWRQERRAKDRERPEQ